MTLSVGIVAASLGGLLMVSAKTRVWGGYVFVAGMTMIGLWVRNRK